MHHCFSYREWSSQQRSGCRLWCKRSGEVALQYGTRRTGSTATVTGILASLQTWMVTRICGSL